MSDIDVEVRGAMLEPARRLRAFQDLQHGVEVELAREGERLVRSHLGRSMRRPTGRYLSHLHVARAHGGHEITDGGMVYGPWLEGTSSRNRTTRFKGYRSFRKAAGKLERGAERYTRGFVDRWIAKVS